MSALQYLRLWALPRSLPPVSIIPLVASRLSPSTLSIRRWKSQAPQSTTPLEPVPEEKSFSAFKQLRQERLDEIRKEDPSVPVEAYPRLQHPRPPTSIPELRDRFDVDMAAIPEDIEEVTVYGRVVSKRQMGKYLLFLDIVNEYKTVQVMVNWKHIHTLNKMRHVRFQMWTRLIERGDHIAVSGVPVRSNTGELTIKAAAMPDLLTPVQQPIPTEYVDLDKKMERRHIDMLITPQVSETLRMRSGIINYIRDFLKAHRFLEVQTPILAHSAGGAIARPFTTSSTEFPKRELALRVAPELWLKRLVVGGMQRVFEIGPAFRNEGIDLTHNPEFTMCEFYSAYTTLSDLITFTESLISGLAFEAHELIQTSLGSLPPIDLDYFSGPYNRVKFIPALEECLGMHFPNLSAPDALSDTLAALELSGIKVPGDPPATIAKLLDRLAAEHLEPLSFEKPLFITHHPAVMSPLAKSFQCSQTGQEISARTELFVYGRELANMYEEENDPAEQQRKMIEYREAVLLARKENRYGGAIPDDAVDEVEVNPETGAIVGSGEDLMLQAKAAENAAAETSDNPESTEDPTATIDETPPIDEKYIDALEAGLPPTGGWGCGIERLVMLFTGTKRISDCLPFGTLKNVIALGAQPVHKEEGRDRITRKNKTLSREQR